MIHRFRAKIRAYLFQALLALLPFMLTLFIAGKFIDYIKLISAKAGTLVPIPDTVMKDFEPFIPIIVFFVILLALIILGMIIRTVIGNHLLSLVKELFKIIPGLNRIYLFIEQLVSVMGNDKESFLKNPVFVEYPSSGIRALGFYTGEMAFEKDRKKYGTVFIPTTPNPTSGVLAIIETKKIKPAGMTTEEALSFILTGGMVKKERY
jgi:uncharacterized membrane protein